MTNKYTTEHAFELGYERGHEVGAAEEANAIAVYVRAEIHRLLTFYGYHGAERVINALQNIHDGIRNDAHWVNYYNDAERQRLQDLENDTDE